MKILNLYSGIGGNRKLWKDVEVTEAKMSKLDKAMAVRITKREEWFLKTGDPQVEERLNVAAVWVFPCGCWFEELKDGSFYLVLGNQDWQEKHIGLIINTLQTNWHDIEHKDTCQCGKTLPNTAVEFCCTGCKAMALLRQIRDEICDRRSSYNFWKKEVDAIDKLLEEYKHESFNRM